MKKIFLFLLLSPCLLLPLSFQAQEKKLSEPIKPALIVIDVQNAFLPMVEAREKEVAFYLINAYIEEFRKLGLPIIRVYHSSEEYSVVQGKPEFEFPAEIAIKPDDPMVIKTYGNAFTKTDLEKVIKETGANTLFLCGLSSVGCVLATYFGAKDVDLKAFLLKDALMSHNATYTDQVENIWEAVGWEVVEAIIK